MAKVSIKKALAIQFASKYLNVIVQLVLTAILARMVTPEQYGLIATVTIFTALFTLLSDLGIGPAIIQFKELTDEDCSALFTFSGLLSVALSALFYVSAYPIALFYGNDALIPLCQLSSVSIFFNTLNMVPNGLLLRRKEFPSIGKRLIISTIVSGLAAVVLAFLGFGAYSLVWQSNILALFVFTWNIATSNIKIGNIHFIKPLKLVVFYAANQAGFGIVNYFSRNMDKLAIGKTLGETSLGMYDKAYRLIGYPVQYLSGIIGSVLQPYYSERQNDKDFLYQSWIKISKPLSLAGAFLGVFFFTCSYEVTVLFYGDQWAEAAPILSVLSLSLYFQIVNNPLGAMFQSSNHTDYLFYCSLINTALTLIALLIGSIFGQTVLIAVSVSISYCIHTVPLVYFFVRKTLHKGIANYLLCYAPEVISAVVAGIVCYAINPWISIHSGIGLIQKFIILAIIYLAGCLMLGQKKYFTPLFRKDNNA